MLFEIQATLARTIEILASKEIGYSDLRSSLRYGLPVHERLLPNLHKGSSRSVLVGDYIDHGRNQNLLIKLFDENVVLKRDVNWRHSSQFYIIYVNNLTDEMFRQLDDGFAGFYPYIGYADTTYASRLKSYLSTILVNNCIQNRNIIIGQHEDDRPGHPASNARTAYAGGAFPASLTSKRSGATRRPCD